MVCVKHEVVPAPCVLGMLFQDSDEWKGYFGVETVTECGSIGEGDASSPGNQLIVGKLVRKLSRVGAHLLVNVFHMLKELYSHLTYFYFVHYRLSNRYSPKYCSLLPSIGKHGYS